MPLYPDANPQRSGADQNSGGRLAGACTGATFLKTFASPMGAPRRRLHRLL